MAKIYGQLEQAQLQNVAGNLTGNVSGRAWFDTTAVKVKFQDGTLTTALLANDQKCVFGTSGTGGDNIRLNRGASGLLQFVTGADTTVEGTMSTALAKLSFKFESYATAGRPAAGAAGRMIWNTDVVGIQVDTGSTWVSLSAADNSPSGSVIMYAGATAPTGWLLLDGSAISRVTYSVLFGIMGTTYGVGDGSTTFNLPDARGIFVRGAGSQIISSKGYTGTRGTTENDQFQGHYHSLTNTYSLVTSGAGAGANAQAGNSGSVVVNPPVVQAPTNDGTNGIPRVGSETRPANITLSYIIKI